MFSYILGEEIDAHVSTVPQDEIWELTGKCNRFYLHIYLLIIKKVLNNMVIIFASDSNFQGEKDGMKPSENLDY